MTRVNSRRIFVLKTVVAEYHGVASKESNPRLNHLSTCFRFRFWRMFLTELKSARIARTPLQKRFTKIEYVSGSTGIGNLRSFANWNVMAAFVAHIPVDNVSIEQCAPVQFRSSAIGNMNVKLFCLFFSLSYFSVNDPRWSCMILCKHIGKDYRVFGHRLYSFPFPLVVMFLILLVPFFFLSLPYPFFVVTKISPNISLKLSANKIVRVWI